MKQLVVPMAVAWVFVMLLPMFMRMSHGENAARLRMMKQVSGTRKVLFIFEGMMAPPMEFFWQFASPYDGDVIYVQYAHDGCAMDKYCLQIRALVAESHYAQVDVLGISIGSEIFPTLVDLFGDKIDLRLYGVCPAGPSLLHDNVRRGARILAPILIVVKMALGAIGEIPFICWDGVWRSFSEMVEQGIIAVWGRPFWQEWYSREPYPVWRSLGDQERRLTHGHCCRLNLAIKGFVLAEDDEFIDNGKVVTIFFRTPVRSVHGAHAQFVGGHAEEYVEALRQLGLYG